MIHVLISNYKFSIQKKIRLCQDKYWRSCTESECAAPGDICCLFSPFHGQSLEIVKVSGGRSSSRINLHVGYESFLKKTMSEKSLITKYEFIINYILPVVMPTLRKFCNVDCLASLHLYIRQVDTGHVCKFVRFNITLQCSNRWSTEKSIIWLINIHCMYYYVKYWCRSLHTNWWLLNINLQNIFIWQLTES